MLTDAELLELEILLIDTYKTYVFRKIYYNEATNEIVAIFKDLEHLLAIEYAGRYKTFSDKVILSLDLFNLLKLRYFSRNETVIIKKLKLKN